MAKQHLKEIIFAQQKAVELVYFNTQPLVIRLKGGFKFWLEFTEFQFTASREEAA